MTDNEVKELKAILRQQQQEIATLKQTVARLTHLVAAQDRKVSRALNIGKTNTDKIYSIGRQ